MLKKVVSDEKGRVLGWTLVILGLGALLLPVLLARANTNLLATRTIEEGLKEQYAADSGVEYALLQLQNGITTSQSPYTYTINNKGVEVTWGKYEDITGTYKITSTATSQIYTSSTAIESYVEFVAGGNLNLFHGALASEGDLSLKDEPTDPVVNGDVYCGGDLDPDDLDPNGGDVYTEGYEFPSQEQIEEFAEGYKEEAMACGDPCIWEGDTYEIPPEPTDLGPMYIDGNLEIDQDITVTLGGTVYVEGEITMRKESEFTGSGSIIAVGEIYLRKMGSYGTDGASIIMSLNGGITFKKETDIDALIYAPNGPITFDKGGTVTGSVVGASIESKKGGSFTYNPVHYESLLLPGYRPSSWEIRTYHIYP